MDLAAAWSWRFIVVCGALAIILWLLNLFLVVVLPVVIALLIAALVSPVVVWGERLGLPRKLSALLIVILGIGLIALLLTFVSNQVSQGVGDLSKPGRRRHRPDPRLAARPARCTSPTSSSATALDKAQEQIAELQLGRGQQGRRGRYGASGTSSPASSSCCSRRTSSSPTAT